MKKNYTIPNLNEARKREKNSLTERIDFCINQEYKDLGLNLKYLIKTHGCQANQRDSETIAGLLEELKYIPTTNE